ncbi:VOC family protein [Aestuariibius insulae]|uniref:VOC family protein n=1 Tax=Aestuariibius insulae TaxID=2058287 RepID=UPI00345E8B5E
MASLEHVNVTVVDPAQTAEMLCDLFGWKIRWQGDAMMGGHTKHVGDEESYLAIYSPGDPSNAEELSYGTRGGLNHIGVVVGDLDAVEEKVKARGYKPENHGDYEPGKRFYFTEENGIEIEVVSYA